jgi:predicted PurR-regulated permease PerM
MWFGVFVFAVWFFYSLLGILIPFLIAFLLAYLLNPVVTILELRRVARWVSSLVVVVVLIAVAVTTVLFVVPPAAHQFQSILSSVAIIAQDVTTILQSGRLFEIMQQFGIPVETARELIADQVSPRLQNVLTVLFEGVFGFVTGFSSVLLHLINIVIIPFLLFYLLKDFPELLHSFSKLISPAKRERALSVAGRIDEVLGQYFRGAIIVAIIQGTIAALALTAIGVRYPLVLGIMTGILNFIPYVGLLTSLVVSCIVALMSGDPVFVKVVAVVALFLSQKLLEAGVLGPKIIGTKVGLHPVLLILSLLVFGYFLGFIGMLIAVPATALLMAFGTEWLTRRDAGPLPSAR